jgi:hypothetical protein
LIGQVHRSGNRHLPILNINIQPVPRDRQIPVERVQNAQAHVIARQPHLYLLPSRQRIFGMFNHEAFDELVNTSVGPAL